MNYIKIDLERTLGNIDHNIFGGYLEHGGRVIYSSLFTGTLTINVRNQKHSRPK